ncbi:MAG TPA: hypothetical protein VLH84_00765 [Patescibacteria group bacterium]|nr:hypothetical protein [Patescibacteria group bacterium]
MSRQNRPSKNRQAGQTIIALLIFVMMSITITTAAATVTIINIRSNSASAGGEQALANADSGAENALQRLLRDPAYAGETVALANGTATISVSGTTMKTIVSRGISGSYRRTITVTTAVSGGVFTVASWSETP